MLRLGNMDVHELNAVPNKSMSASVDQPASRAK